jgi:cytochrome c
VQNNNGQLVYRGEVLLNESDCKGCHTMKDTSAGPNFFSIAHRYYKNEGDKIIDSLARKILTGGSGVWGKNQMSAHPQLNHDQTTEMVKYILSLADQRPPVKKILASGKLNTKNNLKLGKEGFYILEATYTDKGGKVIKPLSATAREVLRYYKLYPEDFERLSDMRIENNMLIGLNTSYASIKGIDVSGIKEAVLRTSGVGGTFEIRIDSINGKRIATFPLNPNIKDAQEVAGVLGPVQGKHDLYLRYVNNKSRFQGMRVEWIYFK